MRFVIYGIGAIGGALAAALTRAGQTVVGIARGVQLEAIRANGLLFRTPGFSERTRFECVGGPAEIAFTDDDIIVLAMKSQHTQAALLALRDAGAMLQPILCAQNGIANERMALRLFPNVYGVTVLMAADYMVPGEVIDYNTPMHGLLEIGRYPGGTNQTVDDVVGAFNMANVAAFPNADICESKYSKILVNLGGVIEAALGAGADRQPYLAWAFEEAKAVYRAAGISWRDVGVSDPRRQQLTRHGEVDGAFRAGSSSTQSLARAAGSIETDYLNGEIVLLGRLHGISTPVNAELCRIGNALVSTGRAGAISRKDLEHSLHTASGRFV